MNEGWGPRASRSGAADAAVALTASRRRVLDLLDEGPKSVVEVASGLGLHVNTAREHLDGLVTAGLALRTRLSPTGRGRPGWGYTLRPGAGSPSVGEYASLAEVLAEHAAAQGGDVAADMARLGRGWGSRLMEGRVDVDSPDEAVIDLLGTLGFDPDEGRSVVRLRQCPMLDVARRHPEVVCQVHLGLVEGALATAGGDASEVSLDAFAEHGACILHLR
jgi:predicted ArsR family transcriptional regulator